MTNIYDYPDSLYKPDLFCINTHSFTRRISDYTLRVESRITILHKSRRVENTDLDVSQGLEEETV